MPPLSRICVYLCKYRPLSSGQGEEKHKIKQNKNKMSLNMRFDAAVFSECAYLFRCSANVGKKWQQPPFSEKIRRNSSERREEFLSAAGDLHKFLQQAD